MPRNSFGATGSFVALATDVKISNAAKLARQSYLAPNLIPDMRVGGNADTKLSFSYPVCNKLLNDNLAQNSFNFASGVFANDLTGFNSVDLTVGDRIFSGCYLDDFSIDIAPFQPVMMNVNFTCTIPPHGLPFVSGQALSPIETSKKVAYGHFAEVSGTTNYSAPIQSNVSYSMSFKRTYSYAVSKRFPNSVFLDEVNKQVNIKSTNINQFINESGAFGAMNINLKNELGELVLPQNTLFVSTEARLSAQNLSAQPGNILTADVTIDEAVL
jgi:hypothetical protein